MRYFLALAIVLVTSPLYAEDTWRFLLLADWHSAEKYTQSEKNPDWFDDAVAKDVATLKILKANYGGELVLMPGDSNSGHWERPAFIKQNNPGATPEEAVLKAGKLCYSGMIGSFKKGGYSKLLMAVGDHEMGDNPWPAGSAKSRCQPQFRKAFANQFNTNSEDGRFLYETPIGDATSRPIGTPYEATSYAYRHKNALFVTIDAFHQENPGKVIGSQGSVTGTITGKHLQWLENVLSEARKNSDIDHIFVQSHLPVIYPVRKVNSSGMMMDDGINSSFWKTLRKHKVDIYFAGEVHANTVTQDQDSSMIQLVSRGNFFNNFQTLDVSDDRIEVTCFGQQPGTETSEGKYSITGKLLIDKSGKETQIEGTGELALLDVNGRHFYYNFEGDAALADNPIMGLSTTKGNANLRGRICSRIFPNLGTFGPHYAAITANVDLVEGVQGKAGKFTKESRMGVFAMGPLYGKQAVSYSLWVRSKSKKNQMLINTGSIWGKDRKGFFNLHLNNGAPEVMVSEKRCLTSKSKINDGEWHHIAVSMPSDGCLLSEVQIYVDGKLTGTSLTGQDLRLHFNQAVRMGFGGLNYSSKAHDRIEVEPFVGSLDEIAIWTRPLRDAEVASLFKSGE